MDKTQRPLSDNPLIIIGGVIIFACLLLKIIQVGSNIGKTEHCFTVQAKYQYHSRNETYYYVVDKNKQEHEVTGAQYALAEKGATVCVMEY